MKLNTKYLIGILLLLLVSPVISVAEVVFKDNFDGQADWSPAQQSTSIDCSIDGDCPIPLGYFGWRMQGTSYSSPGNNNSMSIAALNYRGSSGKALTFWSEVCASCGWASDALLDIQLEPTGYPEIYIRFYMKFQSGWRWSIGVSPMQKFLHVSHYDKSNPITRYNFFDLKQNKPRSVFQFAKWRGGLSDISTSTLHSKLGSSSHTHVSYPSGCTYGGSESGCADPTTDGKWHSMEFYYRINSADGLADGVTKVWLDGVLFHENTEVIWVAGDNPNNRLWNYVWLGGNSFNPYAPQSEEPEQWYAIDDLVISTSFIGPESVPVGGFNNANTITADQIMSDVSGQMTISFKALDEFDNTPITVSHFEYSKDNAVTWISPTNGDRSEAFSANWSDNSYKSGKWTVVNGSESEWSTATAYSFIVNTKHSDFADLNDYNGNVQFRFYVQNGNPTSSNDPVATEPVILNRVPGGGDNIAPNPPTNLTISQK